MLRRLSALVVGIVVAACGAAPAPAATSSPAPTAAAATSPTAPPTLAAPVKMTIAYSSVSGDKLALFVAAEAGIFKKHNIDIDPQNVNGSTEAVASLIAGQATLGQFSSADALSATAGGADLVIVGIMTPVYPYHLFVKPTIKTVADLKGKKLAVTDAGGATDIATRAMLKRNGLDPDKDVDLISAGSHTNRTAALLNGAVDGEVDDVPSDKALIAAGFVPLIDLAAAKVPASDSALVFQRSYVNAHKDVVQAYVDSMVEALAYARKNKDFTVSVLGKYFKSTDTALMQRTADFFLNEVLPTYPSPDQSLLGDAIDVLSVKNASIKSVDLNKLIDPSYVNSAKARNVSGS